MPFRPYGANAEKVDLIPVLPSTNTVNGEVASTDIGKLIVPSSHNGVLALGTTADTNTFLGIVAAVPVTSTVGSTQPFYIRPIVRGALYKANYSTSFSTSHPATTDIGKYVGLSNTTTVAGGSALDMSVIGNAPGTTDSLFFRIAGYSTERNEVIGTFNSSHIATQI